MYQLSVNSAQEAFEHLYQKINALPVSENGTKSLQNVAIEHKNPMNREILTRWRNWNESYAKIEWDWYLSEDRTVELIGKHAKIWNSMVNEDFKVLNSNYGYQWNRNCQLDYVINELTRDPQSRRAYITILDSKEHDQHVLDTPCTPGMWFRIINGKLNMTVTMRSNDLWFGYCNDQYTFAALQSMVAERLGVGLGAYTHIAFDMHLYARHFDKK